MSEREEYEKREEQRDMFTFIISLVFFCIMPVLAHGFFGFAAIKLGGVYKAFPYIALYVFPGLFCGFVWRKWGVLIGAIVGLAVRLLSVINMGYLVPLKAGEMRFSFDMAVREAPGALVLLVVPMIAGAAAAVVGYLLAEAKYGDRHLIRWVSKIGLALLALGFIVSGGVLLFSILPFGKLRGVQVLASRLEKVSHLLGTPLAVVTLLGCAIIVFCVLIALREVPGIMGGERRSAPRGGG